MKQPPLRFRSGFVAGLLLLLALIMSQLTMNFKLLNYEELSLADVLCRDLGDTLYEYGYRSGPDNYIEAWSISYPREDLENLDYIESVDPQELANDKEELRSLRDRMEREGGEGKYWLYLINRGGKFTLTSNKDQLTGQKERELVEEVEKRVNEWGGYFHEDYVVERVYSFDPATPQIERSQQGHFFFYRLVTNLFILLPSTALLVMIFTVFTDYRRAKEWETFRFIIQIPIEVYLAVVAFLPGFGFFTVSGDGFGRAIFSGSMLQNRLMENMLYIHLGIFLAYLVFAAFCVLIVLVLKSFYHNGLSSFVIQNSVVYRLFRFLIWTLRAFFGGIYRFIFFGVGLTNRKVWLGIYAFLIIAAFFMSMRVSSFTFFLFSVVVISILFHFLNKILRDFRELEDMAGQIAEGNYSQSIDEEKTLFPKLVGSLNASGQSLALAVGKELRSEKLKTELITNVSHDLKTPLTSIINYSELVADEQTPEEERRAYAGVINDKALQLKKLIESLFDFSKIHSHNVHFEMTPIDLVPLLTMAVGEWADKLDEKKLDLVSHIPEGTLMAVLDGQQTYRVFDNIFSNIYKYALEGTRVYVDVDEGDRINLSIKNISKYPLNISPEELMERFVRGDQSRQTEGSGLGLSIARSLTEQQGGLFDLSILGDLFEVKLSFPKA